VRSLASIAALRQLQHGFDEHDDAYSFGERDVVRGDAPRRRVLKPAAHFDASMSTTNRVAPGFARKLGVADVRARWTEAAQDSAMQRGPHPRDSQRCTCELALHERAESREATKPRAASA
jgi:hypothetical protein